MRENKEVVAAMSTRLTRLAAEHPAAVESARHEAQHSIEYRIGAA